MQNDPISLPPSIIHSHFSRLLGFFPCLREGTVGRGARKSKACCLCVCLNFDCAALVKADSPYFRFLNDLWRLGACWRLHSFCWAWNSWEATLFLNLPRHSRCLICSSVPIGSHGFALFLSWKVDCPRKTICGCKRNPKILGHFSRFMNSS